MIIEFFGLPFSGKTILSSKLKNSYSKRKKITNYTEITFFHLYSLKKINLFEYKILKKIEYEREFSSDRYKRNIFSKLLKSFLFKILNKEKIQKKIDELFDLHKKEYLDYLNFLKQKVSDNPNKSNYLNSNRIKHLIIGHSLNKKYNNFISINSEGFLQICLSLLIRIKMDLNDIKKYLSLCPSINYVFVTISERKEKKKLIKFLKQRNNKFLFDKTFIKNFFFTIKYIKYLKGRDVNLVYKMNFQEIKNNMEKNRLV